MREQLDQQKPTIDDVNKEVMETLKPSAKHDWTRALEIKVRIVEVAIAELPVLLISDAALTGARKTRDAAERLYSLAQWATYFLFTVSIVLGLYATLKGIKGIGEPE